MIKIKLVQKILISSQRTQMEK